MARLIKFWFLFLQNGGKGVMYCQTYFHLSQGVGMNRSEEQRQKVTQLIMDVLRRIGPSDNVGCVSGFIAAYDLGELGCIAKERHAGLCSASDPECTCGKREAENFVGYVHLAARAVALGVESAP